MLIILSAVAFLIGFIVHEANAEWLFDWAGWMLAGLVLFAAGHIFPWAPPWSRRP